jgi:hypothetical protein
MENDLVSIYENNYLQGSIIEENRAGKADINKNGKIEGWEAARDKAIRNSMGDHDSDEDEEDETAEEAVKRKMKNIKKSKKSMKKKSKEPNPGAIYGDSFKRSGNIFDQILREMDEMNGGNFGASSADDNVFNADDQMDSGEEETFTLSELRSMSLGELANLLAGGEDEGEEYGDEMEDEGEEYGDEMEDGVPAESYGFNGGEGNYPGSQRNYDGKAQRAKPTTFIKGNGDADFGDQDTGYDPDDTEGSEGSYLGDQGDYDGKAKKQAPSSHVKANGDADFSKAKTGIKTSSGKKPKNYF